jgi:hypothetical protein
MKTRVTRRAVSPAGATRPQRASGMLRGRAMPARITATSCAALLTGVGLLLIAGCSSAGTSSTSGSPSSAQSHGGRAASAPEAFAAASGAAVSNGPAAGPAAGSAANASARLIQSSQSIIYTASLTVRVRHAAAAASTAVSDITAAGGYTAAEQAQASPAGRRRPRVSLTLKVPVAGYGAALSQLSGLGKQTSLRQQSSDVTQEVADVGSRVTSQQDAITQLRALLKRTGSVTGLLQVQDQISGDESNLEALLAQQRALDHETTYATISVLLLGPLPRPAAHHKTRHGFASGLGTGWRGFRHTVGWVLTALGVVLPFAIVLAIVAGLGYLVRRRFARHQVRPAEAEGGS